MQTLKINPKNLRRLCGLNGMTVVELARRIQRNKVTVYRAVRHPQQYRPTYQLVGHLLPQRSLRHVQRP